MSPRPPVVAILGHVDHGKTTLLDYIRKTDITAREHGGITQKIGAYEVTTGIKGYHTQRITFIDTPGHEAFSKLRSRGANVADIAILIIDAKDSLKPQTVESIQHILAAHIPFIVAINKIDLPEANPDKVKTDLLKHEVMVEDRGGKVPAVLISAKSGKGVDELLETILLVTSDKDLQYDPAGAVQVYVIETKKDKRGIVASCIIKDGVIKVGDMLYEEENKIKVRSMTNDRGESIKEASPSAPFELQGFDKMPEVGAVLTQEPGVVKESPVAEAGEGGPKSSFEDLLAATTAEKRLPLVIKADTQGSVEAIAESISQHKGVEIISVAVGSITQSDVLLAKASKAIVIGFNTTIEPQIEDLARQEKVVIKTYNIIYELLDELTEVADLLREKEAREKNLKGEAKVLATFIINEETVFGVRMTKGKANMGDTVELYRDAKLQGSTKLVSLRVRAKSVPEVKKGPGGGHGLHTST